MTESTELTAVGHFELAWRQAKAFAGSTVVPDGMRTPENCMAAIMMADEMGESRLAVIQNLSIIHGRPAWQTAFMISRANRRGAFQGKLRWRTLQKDTENVIVECYGDLVDGGEDPRVSITIDLKTAIESGWTTYKKDNKILTHARWATPTMIEQMLRWRTASWIIRLYASEVMMGLPTNDEIEDVSGREMVDVTPPAPPKLEEFTRPQREEEQTADVPLYTLVNCDGEPFECTADTVEREMLAIFAEASKRGEAALAKTLENNLHVEVVSPRLAREFRELRAYLAACAYPAADEAAKPKRPRATKAEMEERRRRADEAQAEMEERRWLGKAPLPAGSPDPQEQTPVQEAEPSSVEERYRAVKEWLAAPQEQNPGDGLPVRPPAETLSDDGNASPTLPPSPGEAEPRTQPSPPPGDASLIVEPVYDRNGEIAYRAWFHGALFNALRKDSRAGAMARLAANGETIQAYFRTISSRSRAIALDERDAILKELK